MSTDPFIEAAREESERYFADPGIDPLTLSAIDHAMHMAEWARDYLAEQESTRDEIEAAARAIFEVRDDAYDLDEWEDLTSADRERYECDARAALSAARAARREEDA